RRWRRLLHVSSVGQRAVYSGSPGAAHMVPKRDCARALRGGRGMTDATQLPTWFLEKMLLPRGPFTPEQRAAAQEEIKRRCGFPPGSIKIPPKEDAGPEPAYVEKVGWVLGGRTE